MPTENQQDQFNEKVSTDELNTTSEKIAQILSELDGTEGIGSMHGNFSPSSNENKNHSPISVDSINSYSNESGSKITDKDMVAVDRQSCAFLIDEQADTISLKRPLQNMTQTASKRGRRTTTLSTISRSSDEDRRRPVLNGRTDEICNAEELRRLQIRESNREAARRCRERRRRHIERLEDLVQNYEIKIAKLQTDNNELHKEVSRLKGYILQNMECFPATIIWKRLNGDMLYPLGLSSPLNVFQGENYNQTPLNEANNGEEPKSACSCSEDVSHRNVPLNLSNPRSANSKRNSEYRSCESDRNSECASDSQQGNDCQLEENDVPSVGKPIFEGSKE